MGTGKTTGFRLLEERAQEIVERLKLLKEENTGLKLVNAVLLDKQAKARLKVRELLNQLEKYEHNS